MNTEGKTPRGRRSARSRCLRCSTPLPSGRSGYGRECAARIRHAATAVDLPDYSPRLIDAARELIEDAGLVPVRGRRVFRVVSSDGATTYLTAAQACTCPAGLHERPCYHRAAVAILAAADEPSVVPRRPAMHI